MSSKTSGRAKFLAFSFLIMCASSAVAEFNWNVSLDLVAPVYPVYRPRPVRRIIEPVPVVPSVGFSLGDENFGIGVQIPLTSSRHVVEVEPVYIDCQDYTYWEIQNDTDYSIYATNQDGNTVCIRPDQIKKLSHRNGWRLTIKDQFDRTIQTRAVDAHFLTVQHTRRGGLHVIQD